MIGTLWTGIVGMKAQQIGLENESNNISNVNTVGFKSARVNFSEQLYNSDMGHGTVVENLQKNFKQGSVKTTGHTYDMSIQGDGFFVLKKEGRSQESYTRAGNFDMNTKGYLNTQDGFGVQGYTSTTQTYQYKTNTIGEEVHDKKPSISGTQYVIDGVEQTIQNSDRKFNEEYTNLVYNNIDKVSTVNDVTITSTITRRSEYPANATVTQRIDAERGLSQYIEAPHGVVVKLPFDDLQNTREGQPLSFTVELSNTNGSYNSYNIETFAPDDKDGTPEVLTDDQKTQMFNDIESKFQSAFGSTYKMGKLLSDGSFTVRDAVDINKDVYIQARPPMKENPLSFNGDNPILTGTNKITDPATPGATYSIIVDGERYSATDDPTITDVDTMLAALVKESDGTNLTGTSGTHKIYTINNNKYISTDDLLVPIDDSTSTSNPKVKFSNFNNSGNSDINVSDKDGFGIQDAVYKLTIDGVDYSFTDTNSDIGNGADMMANIKDSSGKTLLENGYIYPKDSANGFCIMKNNTIVGEGLVGSNSYENAVYNVEQAGARMLQTNTIVSNSGTLPDTIDLNLDRLGVSENPYGEFSVDENGELSILQNGATVVVGKLAVARFTSNTGLTPIGNNQYRATLESGKAIYATASQMPMIQGQSLEVSNADLSESLINMIIYQRAFEASAKTITTSDELLTTLLGMKR